MKLLIVKIFLVIVTVTLFWRCTDTDSPDLCLLETFKEDRASGPRTHTIEYMNSRPKKYTLVADDTTYVTIYEYDLSGLLALSETSWGSKKSKNLYYYDSVRQLIRIQSVFDHGDLQIDLVRNGTGQVVTAEHSYIGSAGDYSLTETFHYTDIVAANPASVISEHSNGTTQVRTYTYDTHINPLRGLLLVTVQPVNNILTETIDGVVTTFTYQYNGLGYPTSGTASDDGTLEWSYTCI